MYRIPLNHRLVQSVLFSIPPISMCCLCFTFLLLLVLSTSPSQSSQPHLDKRSGGTDSDIQCGFEGDNDTYGLGIRLSLYIQWLTHIVGCLFETKDAKTHRGLANCFNGAMFATLIYITVTKGSDLYAAEALIVFTFCFAGGGIEHAIKGIPAEVVKASKGRKLTYATEVGEIIQISLALGLYSYGVWFFFTGMDNMKHPPCSTFIFFFGKLDFYRTIRSCMKAWFLGSLATQTLILSGLFYYYIARNLHKNKTPLNQETTSDPVPRCAACGTPQQLDDGITNELGDSDVRSQGYKKHRDRAILILGCSRGIFVVAIEMMIQWNNIHRVNSIGSTGQALPVLVAIGGLLAISFEWFKGGDGEREGKE